MLKSVMIKIFKQFVFCAMLVLFSTKSFAHFCYNYNTPEIVNFSETSIPIKTDRSTLLYCTETSLVKGDIVMAGGDNMECKGSHQLLWNIDVTEEGTYELFIIANVRKEIKEKNISFKTDKSIINFDLKPTEGPFIGGRNFQRIKISSELFLEKGEQVVSLSTIEITSDDILYDIRALELVPVSAKPKIEKEELRAVNSRESIDWLVKSGYGLMFHWTSESVQPDGTIKSYEDAVNAFDVEKFANMVEETGAGYVIFTIGHAESYCPAPIKSWEIRHPGKTTERDLIMEIADALNKKGVQLICYLNGPLAFNLNVKNDPSERDKQDFVSNFQDMLEEIGQRYKNKIAGYWFDSWYQIFEKYPDVPFEDFNKAAKLGNDKRIICLNSWIYPKVTAWQDYWAGEVASPVALPKNGYMINGPVPDLPYHALLIMEPYWVQQNAAMPDPRFNASELSQYIISCVENGGAVTVNMGIYQDGTVGAKALEVMREVKKEIRR